jgi:hypothetical protein
MNASPSSREASPKRSLSRRVWGRLADRRFLFVSILVHVMFAMAAIYLVVQTIAPKPRQEFTRTPPSTNPNPTIQSADVAQVRKRMTSPATAKRITAAAPSAVALPEMPAMPMASAPSLDRMEGMAGDFSAPKPSADSRPPGGIVSLFGAPDASGGLEGHFYDLKKDRLNRATGMDPGTYATFLKSFTSGAWAIPSRYKFRESDAALHAKCFFFPAIRDTEAARAFRAPDSGAGLWIAHYKGAFTAPASGSFRLVGFGDNVLVVKIGDAIVLDASDHGYTGRRRERAGEVKFPAKSGATPVFFGAWITLREGEVKPIEVVVGDEGGIFCAGLFLQKQGQPFACNESGLPRLPLVFIGAPSPAEKEALAKYLPPESLEGPYFFSAQKIGLSSATH